MKVGAMNREADTVSLMGLATAFGYFVSEALAMALAVPPWLAHLGASLLSMACGAVMLHFLKRLLHRYWPHPPQRKDPSEE